MTCINPECSNEVIFSRGYCGPCYHRLRKRGTLTRKNVSNTGKCSVAGCSRQSFSKNLCSMHYQRGPHQLSIIWKNIKARYPNQYPEAWNDFETFLADIGERPSQSHQLRRIDTDKPWSADNFVWREAVHHSYKNDKAEYGWRWNLRKKYGLSAEQYNDMLKTQNGLCPIGNHPLSEIDPATGQPIKVCVDHDHLTGNVRGILCDRHNKMLGMAQDEIGDLEDAIAYLKSHKH